MMPATLAAQMLARESSSQIGLGVGFVLLIGEVEAAVF
jgi:hypothetical protein